FFNDTATTEIYTTRHTLSLHDALPISSEGVPVELNILGHGELEGECRQACRSEEHTSELQSRLVISYAVFCLKKKQRPRRRHSPPRRSSPTTTLRIQGAPGGTGRVLFFF